MDARKTIKKYIMPGTSTQVTGMIMAAIAVVSLIIGLVMMGTANAGARKDAEPFYPSDSETGSTAYLDIVGISDWLYNYDGAIYYTAEDAEGYLYTVRISNTQYNKMKEQQEYWSRTSESVPQPEPCRLYGVVRTTSSDIRSNLAECWSITTTEYTYYFGTKLLDTTATAGGEAGAMWFVIAITAGLVALIFLIQVGSAASQAKKHLDRLEERGLLERAAQQLDLEANTVVGKDRGRLSQQFLYGRSTGVVVAYDDILWCYRKNLRTNFVNTNSYLMISTRNVQGATAVNLTMPDKKDVINEALFLIYQRNPETLVGYSSENRKAYQQMRKAEV